ncbi:MAG TPA: hypothetical protein VJ603_03880 [Paucimonas sp.]|nr:hypothetical protein [Paucimonas sp.]
MKSFTLLAASLAIPAVIASAQTPTTPSTTTTSSGTIPFIPLISNGGGSTLTGTTTPSSAWFIDTARNLVVFCTQSNASTSTSTGGTPSFACAAQAAPTAATTPTSGSGATGSGASGSGASGGAGSNPVGG